MEFIKNLIDRGTEQFDSFYDRKRVRVLNVICLIGLFVAIPAIAIFNFIQYDYQEIGALVIIFLLILSGFILNMKGQNQLAAIFTICIAILSSYWVVYLSKVQIGAPFVDILIILFATYLVKNTVIRNIIIVIALVSFLILNYYQLQYLPFDPTEYFTVTFLLLLIYGGLTYSDYEHHKYQRQIEQRNAELKKKNMIIRTQSESLMMLEKEKHEKELAYKQKDIDSVVANNRMQLKIRENLLEQLRNIKNNEHVMKSIKSLQLDLINQIETQKKLEFSHENINEVNAAFHDRLLEKHPNLSKNDLELCSYIRLGLSNKEISALRNSSINVINVNKNRLRKKLDLTSNSELSGYLTRL